MLYDDPRGHARFGIKAKSRPRKLEIRPDYCNQLKANQIQLTSVKPGSGGLNVRYAVSRSIKKKILGRAGEIICGLPLDPY